MTCARATAGQGTERAFSRSAYARETSYAAEAQAQPLYQKQLGPSKPEQICRALVPGKADARSLLGVEPHFEMREPRSRVAVQGLERGSRFRLAAGRDSICDRAASNCSVSPPSAPADPLSRFYSLSRRVQLIVVYRPEVYGSDSLARSRSVSSPPPPPPPTARVLTRTRRSHQRGDQREFGDRLDESPLSPVYPVNPADHPCGAHSPLPTFDSRPTSVRRDAPLHHQRTNQSWARRQANHH